MDLLLGEKHILGRHYQKNALLKHLYFLMNVGIKDININIGTKLYVRWMKPQYFSIWTTKTVAKKGAKTIIIKTQEQDKCRLSAILPITATGRNLPPYLIFKAKNNSMIENQLKKDKFVLEKKCFVSCNINSWSIEDVIMDWYYKVNNNYLVNGNYINEENHGFLILGKATCHCTEKIIKEFQKGNREITFIPGGLTRFFTNH